MKKLLSVLLATILLLGTVVLTGCNPFELVPTKYDNADKYTAGNTEFEGKVDNFTVWWIDGSVTVKTHKENTVKIEETANKEIDDTFRLHWRYHYVEGYGNVLYVRYSASGNFDFGDLKKDITIYLPENDGMDLTVNTKYAAVDLDTGGFENELAELHILTEFGKVSAKIDSADEVRISGQNDDSVPEANRAITLQASGMIDDLGISSSYAKLDVAVKKLRYADVGTVFNDIVFTADEVFSLALSNNDGTTYATVLDFEHMDLETLFAPCELTLSPDASFTMTMRDKSRHNHTLAPKNVSVEFEGTVQEGMKYTVGSGEKSIGVATDSDFRVIPLVTKDDTPAEE